MHGHFPLHPLGHPDYAALRVRCVARSDGETSPAARKLGSSSLRHPTALFPVSPALLARVNGDLVGPCIGRVLTVGRRFEFYMAVD